jgi:ABC-type dipeptide/oligopeptide/nickel transport system permease subunit
MKTYIAWGLLPEAYGNFGPILGSLLVGLAIGICFGLVERKTENKPVFSLEGFLSFSFFLSIALSYEMVASVLITSIFQSIVTICFASLPFVESTKPSHKPIN